MRLIDKLSGVDENEITENNEELMARNEEQNNFKEIFSATQSLGDITIDQGNELFKVKNATSEIKKKSGGLKKATKATAALMTCGMSLAAEAVVNVATKPEDQIFRFSDLISYEIIMDDEEITNVGLGRAAASGLIFGAAGGIAGAIAGKKKTKKAVEHLTLKINLKDFNFPCVMINYINKSVKTSSNAYKDAISALEKTKSVLDLIIQQEEAKQSSTEEPQQETGSSENDTFETLKKLKELLDMGILTEEEFNKKKAEILG